MSIDRYKVQVGQKSDVSERILNMVVADHLDGPGAIIVLSTVDWGIAMGNGARAY